MTFMRTLVRSVSAISVAGASVSAMAQAPTSPAPGAPGANAGAGTNTANAQDTGQLSDIVVTARRISENQQTVPVSVTTVTAADLVARGVVNILQLADGTPNLTIVNGTASSNSAAISIRGQVQTDTLLTVDPSVGVYVDDVYYARAYSVLGDLLDVESVEVLKGPQGTLYGRNTIGGAIKVTTQRPDTSADYTGYIRGSYGNYNAVDVAGALNVPLVKDKLALRVAGSYHNHDGYTTSYLVQTNPATGAATSLTPTRSIDTDNENTYSFRASLRATPIDDLTIDLTGSVFHASDNGSLVVTPNGDVQNYNFTASPSSFSNSPQRNADFYSALVDSVPFARTTVKTIDSTIQWTLSDAVKMKLIIGYVDSKNNSSNNSDGTVNGSLAFLEFQPNLAQRQHQFSAEYQLSGALLNSRLNYLAGLYYFDEKGAEDSGDGRTYVFNAANFTNFGGSAENKSASVFGNAIYSWTDAFRTNVGLRYTEDTKSIDGDSRVFTMGSPGICVYAPGPGIVTSTTNGGPCSFQRTDKFRYTTYEVGADYRITSDVFLYAKIGNGYRGGGEQLRAIGTQSVLPFQPDKVMNYEGGIKSELFDRHVRLNLTYYHTDFSNTQQTLVLLVPNSQGVLTTTTVVANLGNAKINGVEGESVIRIGRSLTLSGGLGYSNFKYADSTLRQPLSPEWTWQVAGNYVLPTAIGNVTAHADYSYRSSIYIPGAADSTTPQSQIAGYGLLNGRLSVDLSSGIQVALFGKNLANKEYYRSGLASGYRTATPAFYGVRGDYLGAPRTYGIEAAFKF